MMKEKIENLLKKEMKTLCEFVEENCPNPRATFSYGVYVMRLETPTLTVECYRTQNNRRFNENDPQYVYEISYMSLTSFQPTSLHYSLIESAEKILEIIELEKKETN